MGMNGTVYPFRELPAGKVRVTEFKELLPPGTLRYLANEMWSSLQAPFRGKMDIYHPTAYLRMPTVRARGVVATHHDCTYERYPELFPSAKKVLWARKQMFPGWTPSSASRSRAARTCCTFTMSIRPRPV